MGPHAGQEAGSSASGKEILLIEMRKKGGARRTLETELPAAFSQHQTRPGLPLSPCGAIICLL